MKCQTRYVKLIFECCPIWLILGQIGYWDDTRQCFFCFFDLSIITVITVLPEKGQNTGNTTFVHKKMTMKRALADLETKSNRIFFMQLT